MRIRSLSRGRALSLFLFLFILSAFVAGTEFFASPAGTAAGDGSAAHPWNLATAFAQPASVRPGDTIWLRGGLYTIPAGGQILVGLQGTAAAPITVAQYPGERATIDIRGSVQGLFFTNLPRASGAAYVHFRDFEITDSDPVRSKQRPVAVYVRTSDHLKFINLVVHDTGIGFDLNTEATNTEVYGSLVYYCDDASDPRGYAHGIYIQNIAGYKKAIDNVVFHNSGFGIHAFPHAGDSALLDVSVIGNTLFNSGLLGTYPPAPDLLVGGDAVAVSPVVLDNTTYKLAPSVDLLNQQLGYPAGCKSPRIENNYFVGTTFFTSCTTGLSLTGNTFLGSALSRVAAGLTESLNAAAFPLNSFVAGRPTAPRVFVRRNQYEAGRAGITVFNWDGRAEVAVDLANVLNPGDRFELRDAQNFFGPPVVSGQFDGSPVRVPLSAAVAAAPVGVTSVPVAGTEFRSFVLRVTAPSPVCPPVFGLPLNPGRPFCAFLTVRDPHTGASVRGEAASENSLFGYFSIPALTGDRTNPEVVVKLLDGRGLNGKFWTFFGSLTDLEYTLTLQDLQTGETRNYVKLAGTSCGAFDIGAFPRDSASPLSEPAREVLGAPGVTLEAAGETAAALVLNPAHPFDVTLSAKDPRTGTVAAGAALPKNGVFGYFSIPGLTGDPSNPEVFIKVLDATSFDGHYWVFYGGLTDLEFTLTVHERSTGRVQTYFKPAGSACGGFDTTAF